MLQVGHDPGPVQNAALRPRQLPLRFLELPFGVAHTLTPNSIKLWINSHKYSGTHSGSCEPCSCLQAAKKPRVSFA